MQFSGIKYVHVLRSQHTITITHLQNFLHLPKLKLGIQKTVTPPSPLPLPLSPTPVSRPLAISQTLQAFALTLSFCRIYLESYKKRLYFKKRHPHSSRTWAFSATPVSTEEAKSI